MHACNCAHIHSLQADWQYYLRGIQGGSNQTTSQCNVLIRDCRVFEVDRAFHVSPFQVCVPTFEGVETASAAASTSSVKGDLIVWARHSLTLRTDRALQDGACKMSVSQLGMPTSGSICQARTCLMPLVVSSQTTVASRGCCVDAQQ